MLYLYIYIHNTLFISEQNILSNKNMSHTTLNIFWDNRWTWFIKQILRNYDIYIRYINYVQIGIVLYTRRTLNKLVMINTKVFIIKVPAIKSHHLPKNIFKE